MACDAAEMHGTSNWTPGGPLWAISPDVLTGADAMGQRSEKRTSRSGQRWTDRSGGESTGFADKGRLRAVVRSGVSFAWMGHRERTRDIHVQSWGQRTGTRVPWPGGAVPSDVSSHHRLDRTIGHVCLESECRWGMRGCPDVRVGPMGHGHGTSGRSRAILGAGCVLCPWDNGEVGMRVSKRMNDRELVQQRRLP